MKKIKKNKKELSPVVAMILLIAVTIAISFAVAVWLGAVTFSFMEKEYKPWSQKVEDRINTKIQISDLNFNRTQPNEAEFVAYEMCLYKDC